MYVRNFLLRGWGGREIGAEGGGSGEVRGEGREVKGGRGSKGAVSEFSVNVNSTIFSLAVFVLH